jgi:DNA-binding transcriptional MerR regulator
MSAFEASSAAGPLPLLLRAGEAKAPSAFRTISEVATSLEVPQHVLRFWESKFQQVRPLKRGGGRRYYRPEDVVLLTGIKDLLYNQGFTIRGVQKLLREGKNSALAAAVTGNVPQVSESVAANVPAIAQQLQQQARSSQALMAPAKRRELEGVLNELKSLRELLRQSGV